MDELLQKLLETNLLTEESKKTIAEQFTAHVKQIEDETRTKVETEVRAQLAEQFVADKETLIEALDTKAEEFLKAELAELKEDVERFRDLEAEHAEKLVEARKEMAEVLKKDMTELVDTLDTFLEMRLKEEFTELRESIDQVKKLEFGRRIFEAVAAEFETHHADKDGTAAALAEAKTNLENTQKVLAEAEAELKNVKRAQKLAEVLEPLQGRSREVMEAILKNIPTEKLAEAYGTFIGRVLNESRATEGSTKVEDKSEKDSDTPVLAEGADSTVGGEGGETKVVSGDTPALEESVNEEAAAAAVEKAKKALNPELANRLRELAGTK